MRKQVEHTYYGFLILCIFLIAQIPSSYAQEPPVPARKALSLEAMKEKIEREKARKTDLAKKQNDIEKELEDIKQETITLARKIQQTETELQDVETRLQKNRAEKTEIEAQLGEHQGSMAETVAALVRIRRVPPEALIVRPGAPLETAQTSLLLKNILPAVQSEAERLIKIFERLDVLNTELQRDQQVLTHKKQLLEEKNRGLSGLIAQRQNLHKQLGHDIVVSSQTIERMMKEAKSLEALLQALEKKREEQAAQQKQADKRQKMTQKLPLIGDAVYPVAGIVQVAYGEEDDFGATSRGITIRGRSEAIVVAPMGGKIQFANKFKNYGQLVIIEHRNKYHSLIGGIGHLSVSPGQIVKSGEPVGILPPESSRYGDPRLYYELRQHGKPLNPVVKLSNSKS